MTQDRLETRFIHPRENIGTVQEVHFS